MLNKFKLSTFFAFIVIIGFVFIGCDNGLINDVATDDVVNTNEISYDDIARYPVGTTIYRSTVTTSTGVVTGVLQQIDADTLRFTFDTTSRTAKTVDFRVELYTKSGVLDTIRRGNKTISQGVSQFDNMSLKREGTAIATFTVRP